jgi:hypothetical protein
VVFSKCNERSLLQKTKKTKKLELFSASVECQNFFRETFSMKFKLKTLKILDAKKLLNRRQINALFPFSKIIDILKIGILPIFLYNLIFKDCK